MKIGPITIDKAECIAAGMSENHFAAFVEATEVSYLLAIAHPIDPLYCECLLDGLHQRLIERSEAIAMTKRLIARGEPLTVIRLEASALQCGFGARCNCPLCQGSGSGSGAAQ